MALHNNGMKKKWVKKSSSQGFAVIQATSGYVGRPAALEDFAAYI